MSEKSCSRDTFIFYRSFQDAIEEVGQEDQLVIYKAIANYALNKEEPLMTGIAKIAWLLIKPQLDANWRRFSNGCLGSKHGSKGGAPKGNKNAKKETTPKQPQDNPIAVEKTTPNKNSNVNKNENNNSSKVTKATLTDREQLFHDSLIPFIGTYGKEMIRAFFDYWSEPNPANTKMRFELQKTWSLEGRLRMWERRSNDGK